jgi:hypothetical protein
MKMYQRLLFVGLGGTGCEVGLQLEHDLRQEFCGPDGRTLLERTFFQSKAYEAWQLPRCVQFVYADLSSAQLVQVHETVSPARSASVVGKNRTIIGNLLPVLHSYSAVAQNLRMASVSAATRSWLPPPRLEPQVSPLMAGAGQLPTIGRAALFETIRAAGGVDAMVAPILKAVEELARAGGEIVELSGTARTRRMVDIFVAFSVAGGTGCGIFYDFLQLIGHMAIKNLPDTAVNIYPMVLMPSAFPIAQGGVATPN